MKNGCSAFVWLSVLLPAAVAAQAPAQPLRIGTWNLEFLGAPGNLRSDVPPRTDDDLAAIGAKIRSLGVAVLAVQEICGEGPLRSVAAGAGPAWRWALGTTGGWDDGKTAQNIGFLYDDAVVELLGAEELLSFPRELEGVPIFHRVPVTACFRVRATGFDFRMVTVHLKAGRAQKDQQKRRLEATTLHDWVAQLESAPNEDQDIVVLGDFNSTYQAEPETLLEKGGALQYLMPARPTPTIMHFADPIDQVAVAPGFTELQKDSMTVHDDQGGLDKNAWRKTYSDHFPVTVRVDAAADRDPTATFWHGDAAFVLPESRRPGAPAAARAATASAPPASGTPASGAPSPAWPPRIGALVRVTTTVSGMLEGHLFATLPEGPGGWVVIEADGRVRAVPYPQVTSLVLQ
ncbi:MAG TPA: endonuclease/exonuclease/phosphatase family protein [Planctomycetota bacterium]|nr:endonuclease/exonuclease/phosphatase family protein [Planctomycetota bacterium]